MQHVLVTGANGFVGTALCRRLISDGYQITAALRRPVAAILDQGIKTVEIKEIDREAEWSAALRTVDIVVHLAARVHLMADGSDGSYASYHRVNVLGTRTLAQCAADAGIKRFVYLSSVKVNGEENAAAYKECDKPSPIGGYAVSKMEAEKTITSISGLSGLDTVIIRPPLVYGPGVKANFLALMNLVRRRVPLPLGSVKNQRSFIYIGNLVDSVITCINHSAAAGKTYLVSDGRDLSTPELIRALAAAMDTKVPLVPFPPNLLRILAKLAGKGNNARRLLDSLTVDTSKIKNELGWVPPHTVETGIIATVKWYKKARE